MTKDWLRDFLKEYQAIDKRNPIDNSRRDRFRKGWKRHSINSTNHHKEFDLGKLKCIEHNEIKFEFKLNDKLYTIFFE